MRSPTIRRSPTEHAGCGPSGNSPPGSIFLLHDLRTAGNVRPNMALRLLAVHLPDRDVNGSVPS